MRLISNVTRVVPITSMIGDKVLSTSGDQLGKIEDFMVDLGNGYVGYAVISVGGFLGLGDKLFPVPLEALQLSTTERVFILNIPKERLDAAPASDRSHIPDMSDRRWATDVYRYYGCHPYWET